MADDVLCLSGSPSVVKKEPGRKRVQCEGKMGEDEVDKVPENWPEEVVYLPNHSLAGPKLTEELRLHLCTAPKPSHSAHPAQVRIHNWTRIQLVTEQTPFQPAFASDLTTHPTLLQSGLFARRDIPPHTLVVCYLGIVHLASEEDAESRYDAALESDDGTRMGIDATRAGNEARFVNDYRGILQRPNLFFHDWSARCPPQPVSTADGQERAKIPRKIKGLALYSGAHAIRAGTELCASYGKGWWAARAE